MKILSLRYNGVEGGFLRVEASLEKDGQFYHGYVLAELDGRASWYDGDDLKYEGDLAKLDSEAVSLLIDADDLSLFKPVWL